MRIEAFSEARRPDASKTNEDVLLILPGRAHAMLDRVGSRDTGVPADRYASQILRRALDRERGRADLPLDDPWAILLRLVGAILAGDESLPSVEQVGMDWHQQMAPMPALLMPSGGRARDVPAPPTTPRSRA